MDRLIPLDPLTAHLAAQRRLYVLGALFTLYGAVILLLLSPRPYPGAPIYIYYFFLTLTLCLSLFPGLAYLLLARLVGRQKHWAVIASLAIAILHASLNGAVALALWMRDHRLLPVICALCTLLAIILCHPLLQAYLSARSIQRTGFEPILPVIPLPPVRSGPEGKVQGTQGPCR